MTTTTPDPSQGVPPARVLVIDDEAQIRRFLEISLRAQGYRVLQAANGQSGLEQLVSEGADLVILDIGLPDMEGHQVLAELRQWSQVPVIMLTVRASETEKVLALDNGANDYVTKPFGTQELMARVRALLRSRTVSADGVLPHFDDGHLHIDLVRREVQL
ncbi:MAG: response regulator, partial [Stenotrophomonas sp.]